jgi:SAM-dependent methyltransferase
MLWTPDEGTAYPRRSDNDESFPMNRDEVISNVSAYYGEKIRTHGATARGVDWNSTESQEIRFAQLMRVADRSANATVNDFGCGYGALYDYLRAQGAGWEYRGFDVAPPMIEEARRRHPELSPDAFVSDPGQLAPADFTVASGIFNVKLATPIEDWQAYILATVDELAHLSRHGFAFNMLTSYSDADRMRPDLYYGDPCRFFDLCKRKYSKWVALLHDYGLYEFTILVRLEG